MELEFHQSMAGRLADWHRLGDSGGLAAVYRGSEWSRSPAFDLEISLLVPDQSSAADFGRPGWTLPGQSVR